MKSLKITRTPILIFSILVLLSSGGVASATKIGLDVGINKHLFLLQEKQTAYLRIGLTGFSIEDEQDRSPLNIAIVLDKSSSMQGAKIERAKEAAIMALRRLDSRDIVSIVTYDSTVEVVVPATKVSDLEAISRAIRGIRANGSTALFAGVSKGAAEVRKFLDKDRVNRIVLISDGKANVGPSSPEDLASLGTLLAYEGISVTTIGLGLGYNEDLLSALAIKSDGYHYFAEGLADLTQMFDQEFGQALSVVAQGIDIEINCASGVRPIRFLGKEAYIDGNSATISLNNLFSDKERKVILEVELSPEADIESLMEVATVTVDYDNLLTRSRENLKKNLRAGLSHSMSRVNDSTDTQVMIDVIKLLAVEQNMYASDLRDQGRIAEALEVLFQNADFLTSNARLFNSQDLDDYATQQRIDADNLEEKDWNQQRKEMRYGAVKSLF
jgi:Ca-activated chloride channel homolog